MLTLWNRFFQWTRTQKKCIFYKQSHRWKLLLGNCGAGRKREWEREERVWEMVCCCKRVLVSVINLIIGQISRSLEIDNPPEQGFKKNKMTIKIIYECWWFCSHGSATFHPPCNLPLYHHMPLQMSTDSLHWRWFLGSISKTYFGINLLALFVSYTIL